MRNKALPQPGSNLDNESVEPGAYGNNYGSNEPIEPGNGSYEPGNIDNGSYELGNIDNGSFEPDGNRNNEPPLTDGDPCKWAISCESTEST